MLDVARFGESAPGDVVMSENRFTVDTGCVCARAWRVYAYVCLCRSLRAVPSTVSRVASYGHWRE